MTKAMQLFLGLIVMLILLGMVFVPGIFTEANPYATEGLKAYTDEEGVFHLEKAPLKPQKGILLGTDELGRHVWALIVYGTKLTLTLGILIVIFRFILAIPFGIFAGFGSLTAHGIIDKLSRFFGTIPTLLLCIIILKMDFFIGLEKSLSILAFVILLGFVGFGKLGITIEERVISIIKEPFVTGDIAIGKNKFQIAMTTVLKHLYPELLVMFFLELARALTLLLQLGLFGVFVGNVRFIEDTSGGVVKTMDISYEPEWASMLGAARNSIRSAPWIIFFPALAFFITVLGLNAFGEGLRGIMSGKVKLKIPYKKIALVAFILIVFFNSFNFYKEVTGYKYEILDQTGISFQEGPVVIGTENGAMAANYIADELSHRDFKPLSGNQYIHEYDVGTGYYTLDSTVIFIDQTGEKDISAHVQYISHGTFDLNSKVKDLAGEDLYHYDGSDLQEEAFLWLEGTFYNSEAIETISERLSKIPNVTGIIWKKSFDDIREQEMSLLNLEVPVLYLDESVIQAIPDEIALRQTHQKTFGKGRNIYAILPGTSETMGDEAIIYGFSYNTQSSEAFKTLTSFQFSLIDSMTKDAANRKRTMIIVFFDGTYNDTFNGIQDYVSKSLYSQKDVLMYMDFTRIQGINEGILVYDQSQSPISRYFAYTFSIQFEDLIHKKNIEPYPLNNQNALDRLMYFEKGFATMIVGLREPRLEEVDYVISIKELGEVLSSVIRNNNY